MAGADFRAAHIIWQVEALDSPVLSGSRRASTVRADALRKRPNGKRVLEAGPAHRLSVFRPAANSPECATVERIVIAASPAAGMADSPTATYGPICARPTAESARYQGIFGVKRFNRANCELL